MRNLIDLSGMKFGKLTVIQRVSSEKKKTHWLCRCECGRSSIVTTSNLRNGHTKSCGSCQRIIDHGCYMEYVCKNGRSFLFDAEDISLIKESAWSVGKDGYVHGSLDGRRIKLHRVLLNAPSNMVVDHINGVPSDCRKQNLRIGSQHQNTMNCSIPKNSTTGYKGVCFDKRKGKYMAHIHPNRRMKFLGYYESPIEAALAYDKAASFYFGSFAKLNFKKEENYESEILAVG